MNTTIVIVCFETQPLIQKAYNSIREIYPEIPVIIVDGSKQRSECHHYTASIRGKFTQVYQVHHNIGHGEGMNFAIKHVQTKYALLMDSDVEIQRDCIGLMEEVMDIDDNLYGIGMIVSVNNAGVNRTDGFPYLHPHFALINKEVYRQHEPSAHHGAPLILPMRQMHREGISDKLLKSFPVEDYILHKGRGTVSMVRRTAYTRGWVK